MVLLKFGMCATWKTWRFRLEMKKKEMLKAHIFFCLRNTHARKNK